MAPLRNPEVNPLAPLLHPILNPLTGSDLGRSDLTRDDDSAALLDSEVSQRPAQHWADLTKMALPLTGTRHTCMFENGDNFWWDISLFAIGPFQEPSIRT